MGREWEALPSAQIHRGPRAGGGHAGALRALQEDPPVQPKSHVGRIEIWNLTVHYIDRAQYLKRRPWWSSRYCSGF